MSSVQSLMAEANRLFAEKNYEQALPRYQNAVAQAPQDVEVQRATAACYYKMRNFAKAIAHLEEALKIAPTDKEIMLNLGLIAAKAGEKTKAMAMYDKLKKVDPTKADQAFFPRPATDSMRLRSVFMSSLWVGFGM